MKTNKSKCLRCTDYLKCQRDEKDKDGCNYYTTSRVPPIFDNRELYITAPMVADRRMSLSSVNISRTNKLWNGGKWSDALPDF